MKIDILSKTIDGTRVRPITLLTSRMFILYILSCFRQLEIRLKITFVGKNPMEVSANLYGIYIKYTIHKQF